MAASGAPVDWLARLVSPDQTLDLDAAKAHLNFRQQGGWLRFMLLAQNRCLAPVRLQWGHPLSSPDLAQVEVPSLDVELAQSALIMATLELETQKPERTIRNSGLH